MSPEFGYEEQNGYIDIYRGAQQLLGGRAVILLDGINDNNDGHNPPISVMICNCSKEEISTFVEGERERLQLIANQIEEGTLPQEALADALLHQPENVRLVWELDRSGRTASCSEVLTSQQNFETVVQLLPVRSATDIASRTALIRDIVCAKSGLGEDYI